MTIIIRSEAFNPWQEIQHYQDNVTGYGATNIFIGTMRDFNDGDTVKAMTLEHYEGMTEKQLKKIVEQASQQWAVLDALIVHRVGDILPNEPIVLVSVWTMHRGDAFDACRFMMEALKSHAPFWKKELLITDEERWVTHNTDGYQPK
ncbi:molybdopterin converting factor [Crenothrix sp. D3]|nr:molybdopterin converting factor [Crenothrix sp. D3]